ncbi:MAG: 50S ribosomal protein L4 [Candidatus Omnitrophota bacterium]|jgi:large subunit ribosomal protein L4|nr:50S ribosomal protein L4 [Candidatus Omnitrophota bacterium]
MAKFPVLDIAGKEKETIELPDAIFGQSVNRHVLHQAIVKYLASARQGNAATKTRGEVSGGGKKPWRQKGTGRARHGSSRSPLWVGGGVIFGPHPRDFSYDIPKKIKRVALRESLNAKYQDKDLLCVVDLKDPLSKTKEFAKILNALKLKGKILALLDGCDPSILRSSRNIGHFHIMRSEDVNAYDILKNKKLLVTKTAVKNLLVRVKI